MEELVKGDVVAVSFPFSDKEGFKRRPALVVANLEGENTILGQITSKLKTDKNSTTIISKDFHKGDLKTASTACLDQLHTIHKSRILYKIGCLKYAKIKEIEKAIVKIFTA